MKKILLVIAAVAAMSLSVVSCKEKPQFGVIYNVEAVATGNGLFDVTYPGGFTKINASGNVESIFTNDTTTAPTFEGVVSLDDALQSNDAKTLEVAAQVNDWFTNNFGATTLDGTYYVHLKGYLKETLSGLIFYIDREFKSEE